MRRLALAALATLVMLGATAGQEKQPEAAQPKWKGDAAKAGLDDAAVKQLERDGLLIADQPMRQAFSAYIEGKLPVFITSDAVLNTFHVLFEESIKRLEQARAEALREALLELYRALPKAFEQKRRIEPPEVFKTSLPRARMVLAVALRLLGEKAELSDDESKIVDAEVKRVEAATGASKPEWLGKPDPGFLAIDYTRFKPLGFYTESETMQRYFRANRWLQTIPFRVDRDDELAAVLLIGWAFSGYGSGNYMRERAMFRYGWFLGTGDDFSLSEAADFGQSFDLGVAWARKQILQNAADQPAISDQLRFIPDDPAEVAEASFRLLPSYRLPDAVLFQRTTDPRIFQRPFPDGLEVAAMLGNAIARETLGKEVLAEVDRANPLVEGRSMYCEYLRTLAKLNAPAEAEAPELFSSRAWQVKSCNAQLAGWAQMRHTWLLQAKMNVYYMGLADVPAGFVEPNPEFWCALGGLCEQIEQTLDELGALRLDYAPVVADCNALAKLIEDRKFVPGMDDEEKAGLTDDEIDLLVRTSYTYLLAEFDDLKDLKDHDQLYKEIAKRLRAAATEIENGRPQNPERLAEVVADNGGNLAAMWEALIMVVRRIETLSHKQLRGVDFNSDERKFIQHIGQSLAACMFYGGNSWLTPRDDAPRATVVATNPQLGTSLHVGIARPRVLYVLYPRKDEVLLCKGAVLPYYEFAHASPLTDSEWLAMQDTGPPECPKWLAPIIENGKFAKAKPRKD